MKGRTIGGGEKEKEEVRAWFACMQTRGDSGGNDEEAVVVPAAGVDVRDGDGRTALHWACAVGHAAHVAWLAAHGAALAPADDAGWTPLMCAAGGAHTAAAVALLRAAPTPAARTALVRAAVPRSGTTALHHACTRAAPALVRILLAAGADPAARDAHGTTPLHRCAATAVAPDAATAAAACACAEALADAAGSGGTTAGAAAADASGEQWAEGVLPAVAADVRASAARRLAARTNSAGETALHVAVQMRALALVRLLIAWGADTTVRDADGRTPAQYAATAEIRHALSPV